MTDPSALRKYLQHQALVYHSNKNIPNRENQLTCLEASVAHIINNPLAIKPYSWALSTLLHSLSVEDALSILQKLIKKNPGSKGLIKLSKLYDLIRNARPKSFAFQYVEVPIGESVYSLENDFLYSWGSLQMLNGRHHEPITIQLMQNILEQLGGSAVHAGSWCGDMLPILSKACSSNNRVYAFEPVLKSYILSKQTVGSNELKNVFLYNMGLGSSLCSVYITTGDGKGVSLGGRSFIDYQAAENNTSSVARELISVIPLDSMNLSGNFSLLHLDIEGSEMNALQGAREFILEKQPIVLLEDAIAQKEIYSKINPFMTSMNYTTMRPIPGTSVWVPANSRIPNSIYNGITEGESFERSFGMMIQKDWLDDCVD